MKPCIALWDSVGFGVIIQWPSGIVFTNQTGGTLCLQPELEGIYAPLSNNLGIAPQIFLSPENDLMEYFDGAKYEGTGATDGLDLADADFIDSVLSKWKLFSCMQTDRTRLRESHEAWVYVTISGEEEIEDALKLFRGFGPYPAVGVITWQNGD